MERIRACREPKKAWVAPAGPNGPGRTPRLLQLNDRALRLELFLDLFGFLLRHAFLYRAPGLDEILRFLEAQVRDRADFLDDLDLLLAAALPHDGELGLLLHRRHRGSARHRPRGRR